MSNDTLEDQIRQALTAAADTVEFATLIEPNDASDNSGPPHRATPRWLVAAAVLVLVVGAVVLAVRWRGDDAGTAAGPAPSAPPCETSGLQGVALPQSLGNSVGYVDSCALQLGPFEVEKGYRFDVYGDESRSEVIAWFYTGCGIEWIVPVGEAKPEPCESATTGTTLEVSSSIGAGPPIGPVGGVEISVDDPAFRLGMDSPGVGYDGAGPTGGPYTLLVQEIVRSSVPNPNGDEPGMRIFITRAESGTTSGLPSLIGLLDSGLQRDGVTIRGFYDTELDGLLVRFTSTFSEAETEAALRALVLQPT